MVIESINEFYSLLNKDQAILAIDYGSKKIGTAISTPDHKMAMPYSIITLDKEHEKINKINDIITQNNICAIVIGLPLNMDGSTSAQTNIVKKFVDKIAKKLQLPIFLQDERLTSKAANNLLKIMGLNRKQRNQKDDMTAASLILETTLNSMTKMSN